MVARVELVARPRDMKPQAVRLTGRFESRHGIGRDDDAPAPLGQIDVNNASGEDEWSEVALQHRRPPLPGRLAHQRNTGGEDGKSERRFAPRRMLA